jgi:hypothetical protein
VPYVDGYERWATEGGYWVRGGTLGRPGVEFVVWVAQAASTGVLGNAAYDGLKELISRVRERRAVGRLAATEPRLTGDEAAFLARLALRLLRIESGLDAGDLVETGAVTWSAGDDCWEVQVQDRHGAVTCAVAGADPSDVLVYGTRA